MTETSRAVVFVAILVLGLAAAYEFSFKPYLAEESRVRRVLSENSTWTVTMQAYHLAGPIAEETYRLHNDNGKTNMYYAATDRKGTIKYFNVPLQGPAGTFLFQELEGDGIWELEDKPVRPHPKDEYIFVVTQTLGSQGGTRSFGFSDPNYWATTKAREFRLQLPKSGSIQGANAKMMIASGGRPLRDDRYLKIVTAVRRFGTTSVQQAENEIRRELLAGSASAPRAVQRK